MSFLRRLYSIVQKYDSYFLLLFFILLGILFWMNQFVPLVWGDWYTCTDLLRSGKLYQGEPRCYHGPLNYFLLTTIQTSFPQSISFAYFIFSFLSFCILVLLMLKIFKKLQLKLYFPIFFLLCFLLLYLPLVNSLGDSIYATLFLLLGFYVLFFFQNDTIRYPLAGFLFTLAIFTRINTIIPFGLAVLYHSKKFFYKEGKFTFDYKEAGFTAFLFLLPVFLLSFF